MAASSQLAARLQCQCSPLSGAAFATDTRASLQGRSLRCSVLARSATTLKLACKLQSSVWGHHIVSESTPVLRRAKGQSDIAPALRATALPSDLIGPQSNRWGAGLKQPLSSQKQNSAQSTNSKSRGVIKNGHTLNGAMRRSAIARLSPAAVHTTSASSSTLSENKLTPAGASPHTASKAGAPGAVHITTQKRSFQGVNVPSWADPGVQTSTLGIPSRTDFQSWKPPTSLGGLWEMVDLEAIGGVSAVPQWAGQTAYTAARMAFFFAQSALISRSLGVELSALPNGGPMPSDISKEAADKILADSLGSIVELMRMDVENVRRGIYRAPYDMDPRHRQWSPALWADQHERLLRDRRGAKELRVKKDTRVRSASEADGYPAYYLQHFHWQPGGWLSDESAAVYEHSTESLFYGAQDMMQRQTLVPLHYFMRGRDPARTSVLDVACGTGRFLTFLKDNYPAVRTYGVDLSPNYLKTAEANMDYFERFDLDVNGPRGFSRAEFIQANAEQLPFEDSSLDVVTCVYLFHELPPSARQAVAQEVSRVLKPGGIFIWTDALQDGDRPDTARAAGIFNRMFHEPYFASFFGTDFKPMFAAAGLGHEATILAHFSKVMCFRKGL